MSVFAGDIANVNIVGRCYGQRILMSLWYKCTIASPAETISTSMNDLSTAIDVGGANALVSDYQNCLQGDYTSLFIRSQIVKPVRTASFDKSSVHLGLAGAGTVANDACAINLRTDTAGRGQHGTKHVGPVPDAVSINGVLTNAYLLLMEALAVSMLNTFTIPTKATTWQPVLFHRATGTATPLTNFNLGNQSRVQRRRTVGVGE